MHENKYQWATIKLQNKTTDLNKQEDLINLLTTHRNHVLKTGGKAGPQRNIFTTTTVCL